MAYPIYETLSRKSWLTRSHYLVLIRMDAKERTFYETESITNNRSLRELKRQFDSALYERMVLSRDKEWVLQDNIQKYHTPYWPEDIIKDPYILEFLGLEEETKYSESDIEQAIINKLEQFLLELGKGFAFIGRQQRFTFDERHFFVDLVFYNRLLQCFVLVDLKIGDLKHQDLGQMQMYVNYYDRFIKTESENLTIGILLCKDKSNSIVEITLPENSSIFASQYQLYLPDKQKLKQLLEL
jgi:predicted nuclease of restriction endonuclease-like (RecB) superfamily